MSDLCEWDPELGLPAEGLYQGGRCFHVRGCRNQAELIVGADGQWRLFRSCAALDHFKRFTTRKEILR